MDEFMLILLIDRGDQTGDAARGMAMARNQENAGGARGCAADTGA
jgi:hypothetical protein